MSNDCKILLVTDNNNSISEIISIIKKKLGGFETADTESNMLSFYESMKPDIIIFHHSDIETSAKAYLHLQTTSSKFSYSNHRAILMCDEKMIPKAIEKCINNVFYDYLVFNPDFDRLRINLLISKALDSIDSVKDNDKNKSISRLGNSLSKQTKEVLDSVSEIDNASKQSLNVLDEVSTKIKANIKDYSSKLIDNSTNAEDSLSDLDLNKTIEAFTKDNIEQPLKESKKDASTIMEGVRRRMEEKKKQYEAIASKLEGLSSSTPTKVLLAEDNEIYSEMVTAMLKSTGNYSVLAATSVHQSILYVMQGKPDVILLDYELVDGNAGDFLEKLAEIPVAKNIPIIMLTSHATDDVYTTTSMMGARAFIKKPASKEIIISKIEKILNEE